jgi:O-6-methylguanine DNA methyltransferase
MTTLESPATAAHTVIDSPCGPLTLVAQDDALAGIYMTDHRHQPPVERFGPRASLKVLDQATEQLRAYFAGQITTFDLALHAPGTPFQQRVWEALRTIPYGRTVTYGELAEFLGQPTASRAVGLANGRNPISIVVPCHRVIGANGSMTGYGGGIARKRWLLDFERSQAQPTLL